MCMSLVAIGRSLFIFSDVTLKMAAWQPYWIFRFPDSNFCLALYIKSKFQQHITGVHGKKPIDFQPCHFQNGHLVTILDFWGSLLWIGTTLGWLWISDQTSVAHYLCLWVEAYQFLVMPLSERLPGSNIGSFVLRIRRHGFWSVTLICLGISISDFMYMLFVAMDRNLLISWQP